MLFLVFLIGAGILFYPTVSDLWNNYRNQQLISEYTEVVETMESEDFSEIWAEAREYNAQHTVNTILDAFDEEEGDYVLSHPYDQVLNPTGNEIMGYLEITELKEKAQKLWGDAYSEKRFHQFFLDMGPAPFSVLEKWLGA